MSWFELNLDEFPKLVETELHWLHEEFDFVTKRRSQIGRMYAGVLFTNSTSHVRVGWEPQDSNYLPVDVGKLSASSAIERHIVGERYPLWVIAYAGGASESEATALENASGGSRDGLRRALGSVSVALSRYAKPLLRGDFSSFASVEDRFVSHMSRNANHVGFPKVSEPLDPNEM